MKWWMREQRTVCSMVYQEVDITPIKVPPRSRGKRTRSSTPVQQRLNDRNAVRYLIQLVNANFVEGRSYLLDPTYAPEHEPASLEEADTQLRRYLRRIAYACKRRGLTAPKYIAVTEERQHFHHHIILQCSLSRDEVEALWSTGRGTARRSLGRVNCDRAQPEQGSLAARARYMVKARTARRRWRQSLGLKKPVRKRPVDNKYTQKGIEKAIHGGEAYDPRYWERKYPGWLCSGVEIEYNELERAPYVRLTLWRPRSPYARRQESGRANRKDTGRARCSTPQSAQSAASSPCRGAVQSCREGKGVGDPEGQKRGEAGRQGAPCRKDDP